MTQPATDPNTTPPTPPTGQAPTGVPQPPTSEPVKTTEWYEAELGRTRNEAASYRTKLREVEARLAQAKTPEEFAAATTELQATNARLERELLVAKVGKGLPDALAALLQGNTEAELKAHAEVLKQFVPGQPAPTPENLGGGLTPGADADDFDPAEYARLARANRL